MLPFGHAAGGYLTGALLAVITKANQRQSRRLRLLGMLGGLLPDFDLVIYSALRQPLALEPDPHHHTWPTHTAPFYLISDGLLAVWARKTQHIQLSKDVAALTASACAHLVQDMFGSGDGIPLLSPVSTRMFGVHLLGVHGKEWRKRYLRDPIFLFELALILASFVHLIRNESYNRKSNLPSGPANTVTS
ncbi:MAG: metal-dependent hydrolase [Chloroflexi bacterium]|nr:metal-dependent hydrolase [Chloroflexota bacterium]